MISLNLLAGSFLVLVTILIALFADSLNLNKDRWIQILFVFLVLTLLCTIVSYINHFSLFIFIGSLYMFAVFSFVILHSSRLLGNKKTLIFILIAGSFGLIFEFIGVNYGIFGEYFYNVPDLLLGIIPITVPLTWTVIIYSSYIITNLFLYGFGGEKPRYEHNLLFLVGFLVLLSAISGLIAVNLDMIMDPVAVSPQLKQWIWVNGGPYFGVPISNFLGWFVLTFFSTLIFRSYESFKAEDGKSPTNLGLYTYAPALYLILFLQPSVQAISTNNIEYVLIGAATMMPFIIVPILLFIIRKHKNVT